MRLTTLPFLLCLLAIVPRAQAAPVTLYDDTLGSLPSAQGWLYLTTPLFGSTSSRQLLADGTRLRSPVDEQAGWFSTLHPAMPVLPEGAAVDLDFSLQVLDEAHADTNRAGFSVILLNAASQGIELGFWRDTIWAQNDNPLFTHGEEAAFTTTLSHDYRLAFRGNDYALYADGGLILDGVLRDYSAHSNPVYSSTSFVFLGDDTSSAGADIVLHSVRIDAAVALPLPSVPILLLIGLLLLPAITRPTLPPA